MNKKKLITEEREKNEIFEETYLRTERDDLFKTENISGESPDQIRQAFYSKLNQI